MNERSSHIDIATVPTMTVSMGVTVTCSAISTVRMTVSTRVQYLSHDQVDHQSDSSQDDHNFALDIFWVSESLRGFQHQYRTQTPNNDYRH